MPVGVNVGRVHSSKHRTSLGVAGGGGGGGSGGGCVGGGGVVGEPGVSGDGEDGGGRRGWWAWKLWQTNTRIMAVVAG